jgi:hypothetical protein
VKKADHPPLLDERSRASLFAFVVHEPRSPASSGVVHHDHVLAEDQAMGSVDQVRPLPQHGVRFQRMAHQLMDEHATGARRENHGNLADGRRPRLEPGDRPPRDLSGKRPRVRRLSVSQDRLSHGPRSRAAGLRADLESQAASTSFVSQDRPTGTGDPYDLVETDPPGLGPKIHSAGA